MSKKIRKWSVLQSVIFTGTSFWLSLSCFLQFLNIEKIKTQKNFFSLYLFLISVSLPNLQMLVLRTFPFKFKKVHDILILLLFMSIKVIGMSREIFWLDIFNISGTKILYFYISNEEACSKQHFKHIIIGNG